LDSNRLKVLITVDVELWPRQWDLGEVAFKEAWCRYILGTTAKGDYGLPFQLKLLEQHGIRAVFLVESLFAWQYGIGPLREIVAMIADSGQEIQLHLHAEWSHRSKLPILPGRSGIRLRDYSEADQEVLVSLGVDHLHEAGVKEIRAFRAGGYGADLATLRVVAKQGIAYDSSYNPAYLSSHCGIITEGVLQQPFGIAGIIEFPITTFEAPPARLRHAQITSCSLTEITGLLQKAQQAGWHSVVIVSHGHELLNADRTKPNPIAIRRFEGLCRFLADHSNRFEAAGFADVALNTMALPPQRAPLSSSIWGAMRRAGEQLLMRVL